MCFPGETTWGLIRRCSEGVLGVFQRFWGCSGGVLDVFWGIPQNPPRRPSEHLQNTPGTLPEQPQNTPEHLQINLQVVSRGKHIGDELLRGTHSDSR